MITQTPTGQGWATALHIEIHMVGDVAALFSAGVSVARVNPIDVVRTRSTLYYECTTRPTVIDTCINKL